MARIGGGLMACDGCGHFGSGLVLPAAGPTDRHNGNTVPQARRCLVRRSENWAREVCHACGGRATGPEGDRRCSAEVTAMRWKCPTDQIAVRSSVNS